MRKSKNRWRILSLLLVAVFSTSCVPPTCLDLALASRPPKSEPIVLLTIYAEPIKRRYSEPIRKPAERRHSDGIGMWRRFERGAAMSVNTKERMTVSFLNMWPERCPSVSQEDLAEVSRYWQPVVEQVFGPRTRIMMMRNPYTWSDDWVPDGPYVELTYGTVSGESVALMWDGESALPEELDVAVMGTLETDLFPQSTGQVVLVPRPASADFEPAHV